MASARVTAIRDISPHRGKIALALSYDPFSQGVDWVQERVDNGSFVALDVDGTNCAILEIVNTKRGRVLNVVALSGHDLHGWFPELDRVGRKLAADQDCVSISFSGRPGWARMLRRYQYIPERIIMTKAV